ncbi:MAG: hypothetical protein EXR93_00120 [Gemmatimonadetes bacterium]|nr:hypothetical protein [Gemmatimonadota bacterium]
MTRVCLIVDHPDRDLEGMVLLACELARRSAEVFLVPMYERHEILLLRPDIAVVNHVRFANARFLTTCARMGIRVAVLDTEGGIFKDVQLFADQMRGLLDGVTLYCTWGRKQFDALRPLAAEGKFRVVETGCPRYDFATAPWNDAVRRTEMDARRMVLVNTNFALVAPRFQTQEMERRQLIQKMGFSERYVNELLMQTTLAKDELVSTVRTMAKRLPEVAFVIRPHPFESKAVYEAAFADCPNAKVIQEGGVFEWLRAAATVIHHNCSTAIEAFLTDREPIDADWIGGSHLLQPVPHAVSLRAGTPEEMEQMVRACIEGRKLDVPPDTQEARRQTIRDWFHANDGGAFRRVATALLETGDNQRDHGRTSGIPLELLSTERNVRAWLKYAVLLLLGSCRFSRFGRSTRSKSRGAVKRFDVVAVTGIIDRLKGVEPGFADVSASPPMAERGRWSAVAAVRVAADA